MNKGVDVDIYDDSRTIVSPGALPVHQATLRSMGQRAKNNRLAQIISSVVVDTARAHF